MGSVILLVVATIWIAVLVPPLLRSRLENRPNSSVSDFRAQLSSLQKAVPATRAGSMRAMARPLAPSGLARPAATGRPLRSGVTLASGGSTRSPRQQAALRPSRPEPLRTGDPTLRARVGDAPVRRHGGLTPTYADRDAIKRRRANVLFVLGIVAACSVFLAVTTKTTGVAYVAAIACVSFVGYVFLLAQQANAARPAPRPREVAPRRHADADARHRSAPARPRTVDQWDDAEPRRYRGERQELAERQYRGARSQTTAPRVHLDDDDEMWAPTRPARRAPHSQSTSAIARPPVRDELAARRREAARPRSWSEDPHPSGAIYGDPLFTTRDQPIVRRERPARRRTAEWSPAF